MGVMVKSPQTFDLIVYQVKEKYILGKKITSFCSFLLLHRSKAGLNNGAIHSRTAFFPPIGKE